MAAYILDTTSLTHLQHKHPKLSAAVLDHADDELAVTTVNVEETLGGWYDEIRKANKNPHRIEAVSTLLARAVNLLGKFTIHPLTVPALARFDALVKLKLNVGHFDLKIAAIALERGATVVTDNLRDFGRVPGLAVEDWTA
jgi:tRNA(fMet)-specific endonuclease VapC